MVMGGASSSYYDGFPDYIGVESCIDMRTDADEVVVVASEEEENDSRACWRRRKEEGRRRRRKEYPPLIPLLAQTENLHSHMPWVLTRHYTPDGRLILTEEKVRHHEYFRAHRHKGRLTLQLITLDEDVSSYGHPVRELKDEYDDVSEGQASLGTSPLAEKHEGNLGNNFKADSEEEEEEEEEEVAEEEEEGEGLMKAGIRCGGGSKCLSYNRVGVVGSPSSPSAAGACMLGMVPMPALRQVHS